MFHLQNTQQITRQTIKAGQERAKLGSAYYQVLGTSGETQRRVRGEREKAADSQLRQNKSYGS
jgi:hypothetical protein